LISAIKDIDYGEEYHPVAWAMNKRWLEGEASNHARRINAF
jgi:hypothetical protein